MISGPARTVMLAFFGIGFILLVYSFWALYITEIPQEQFEESPKFLEEYTNYYQVLMIFSIGLICIGGIIAVLARKIKPRNRLT